MILLLVAAIFVVLILFSMPIVFALGRITGAFSADDLLGEIFTRFCIGK